MPSDVVPPREKPIVLPKPEGLELVWPGMGWKTRIDHFHQTGKDLYAEVTYYQGTDGSSTLIAGPLDLNLKSGKVGDEHVRLILSRCDLTEIEKIGVKTALEVLLGQLQTEAVRWYRAPPKPVWLHEVEVEQGRAQYLIPKLILKDAINTIVADGGAGKSYLALAIAVALSTGEYQIPALNPLEQGPVLYMDFEWGSGEHTRRLWQITHGIGLSERPDKIAYLKFNKPLGKIQGIHEIVEEIKPVLIIVDSLGYALGGDIKEQEPINNLYQTVLSWGVTALVLHHMNRKDEYFGSVYIRNSTRTLWLMESNPTRGGRELHLKSDKASSGAPGGWLDLRIAWSDNEERVNFYETSYEAEDQRSPAEKVRGYFSSQGEGTQSDVASAVKISKSTASAILGTTEYEEARRVKNRIYYRLAKAPSSSDHERSAKTFGGSFGEIVRDEE